MKSDHPADLADITQVIETARSAFSLELESTVLLRRGRALVVRAACSSGNVIIKRFGAAYRAHFARERAGLRTLGEVSAPHKYAPRLLADDDASLSLLIEAIAEPVSLEGYLSSSDPEAATGALISSAECLGRLHGHARGSVGSFESMRSESPSPGALLRGGLDATLSFYRRALGHDPPAELGESLLDLCASVDQPGPLSTITVGDMAPSNVLFDDRRPVFVDLEYCAVRCCFYDATFWRCICPFPSHVAEQMDAAYFDGLRAAGVGVEEHLLRRAALELAAHRLFWTLGWSGDALFDEDREFAPGVSARAMLRRYLEDYGKLATASDVTAFGSLRNAAFALAERLAALWPDASPALEFPCFERSVRNA